MNTRIILSVATILFTTSATNVLGQFDFGKIIQNEIRQGAQRLEGEFREIIRPGQTFPPIHRPLPYPPITTFPIDPQPPITTYPINPPIEIITQPRPDCVIRPITTPSPIIVTNPVPQPITQPVTQPEPELETQPLPTVESGQRVSIDGQGFGEETGGVFVKIGEMVLYAEIIDWSPTVVQAQLPSLPLVDPVQAMVAVITAEEEVVERMDVNFAPATSDQDAEETEAQPEEEALPEVEMGSQLDLEGEALGTKVGQVNLIVSGMTLKATIINWSDTAVWAILQKLDEC